MQDSTKSIINIALESDKTLNPAERKKILAALNPTKQERERFLSTREVCDLLQVSRRTLFNWEAAGRLTPIRHSKRSIRFAESQILRFAAEGDQRLSGETKCNNH